MTEIHVPDFAGAAGPQRFRRDDGGPGRMLTPRTDELLDEVMGAPPSAQRVSAGRRSVDLRGDLRSSISNGGEVVATVVVKAADGKTVHETPLEPAPVQFGYLANVSPRDLAPGSYVATFDVRSSSPAAVSATRSISLTIE